MSETPAPYTASPAIRASYCPEHGAPLELHDRIAGQGRYKCLECPSDVLWWVDTEIMTKYRWQEEKK